MFFGLILTFFALQASPYSLMLPVPQILASHSISLNDRFATPRVNSMFKDNMLLTLSYMEGRKPTLPHVSWADVEKPTEYHMILHPHEVFAFHTDVLPQYAGKVSITTNAHFETQEGFRNDGYLAGDGVCHLASLLYWTAKDAGLDAYAPTRHDFAVIPDIPPIYGTAIYFSPTDHGLSQAQNLYITNNKDKPVTFNFSTAKDELSISVTE